MVLSEQINNSVKEHSNLVSNFSLTHVITHNLSQYLLNKFDAELNISFYFDSTSSLIYVDISNSTLNKLKDNNISFNITRDIDKLKYFDSENDFELKPAPNTLENKYYYISKVKSHSIKKILNEQYFIKNYVRWIIPSDDSFTSIKEIYSNKSMIPESKLNDVIEVKAIPKIIIRLFKRNDGVFLLSYERHVYSDSIVYIPESNKIEFAKKVYPIYVEFKLN